MALLGELTAKLTLDNSEFNKKLDQSSGKSLDFVTKVSAAITGSALLLSKSSVNAAAEYEKAMVTLDVVSERFGTTAEATKKLANVLGKDLRIGTTAAASSIQNVLKAFQGTELQGNLAAAEDLIRRFTNEAITGKSPTISLSQAVENLSFAYATNNSALGNLSGINENFQDIIERGAKIMGKQTSEMTESELAMAKLRGMIDLTNITAGSSDLLKGNYVDQLATFNLQLQEIKISLGQQLLPIMSDVFSRLSIFLEKNKESIILLTKAITQNLIVAFSALSKIIGAVVGVAADFANVLGISRESLIKLAAAIATVTLGVGVFSKVLGPLGLSGVLTSMLKPLALTKGGITGIGLAFGPAGAAVTAFASMYATNLFGIRDLTTSVVKDINSMLGSIGIGSGESWVSSAAPKLKSQVNFGAARANAATAQNPELFSMFGKTGEIVGSLAKLGSTMEEINTNASAQKDLATSSSAAFDAAMADLSASLGEGNAAAEAGNGSLADIADTQKLALDEQLKQTFSLENILSEQQQARIAASKETYATLAEALQKALAAKDALGVTNKGAVDRFQELQRNITEGNLAAVNSQIQEILQLQKENLVTFAPAVIESITNLSDQMFGTNLEASRDLADLIAAARSATEIDLQTSQALREFGVTSEDLVPREQKPTKTIQVSEMIFNNNQDFVQALNTMKHKLNA